VKRLFSIVAVSAAMFLFVPGTRSAHANSSDSHSLVAKTQNAAVNTYNPVDAPDATAAAATFVLIVPACSRRISDSSACPDQTKLDDAFHSGRGPPA
jgi:hypothetical protein